MSDPDLVSCSSVDPEVQNDTIQSESFVSDLLSNYFEFSLQTTRTSQRSASSCCQKSLAIYPDRIEHGQKH